MNEERLNDEFDSLRLLDRLASGELDGPARQSLFEWLDSDPTRWRRCALVLLETTELQLALGDWVTESSGRAVLRKPERSVAATAADQVTLTPLNPKPVSTTSAARSRLPSLLAAILVAFGLGMTIDRQWMVGSRVAQEIPTERDSIVNRPLIDVSPPVDEIEKEKVVKQSVPDATNPPEATGDQIRSAEVASALKSAGVKTGALPEYVKSQLERRGYQVNSHQKLVSVVMPDGKTATVPVEQWEFRYAGIRAY